MLGSARELIVEGKVSAGSIGADGVVLVIDSVTLPAAGLTAGVVSID